MSDKSQSEQACDLSGIREAVCIHTKKICDACIDKDCIEDLRVYLTRDSQAVLDQAATAKARSAELIHVYIDVEPVQFNSGHYSVDITYYYRIIADAIVGGTRPCTLCGLAVFGKRVILAGGEGSAKVFSSKAGCCGPDRQSMACAGRPDAVVEVVDPMILSAKVVDVCTCCRNDCDMTDLPEAIRGCFDSELVLSGEVKRLYVTIGQFSIIRLERDTQLLIPCYDYCVPKKDCSAVSGTVEDPCEMFSKIEFPVKSFFPACGTAAASSSGSESGCSCGCYKTCK